MKTEGEIAGMEVLLCGFAVSPVFLTEPGVGKPAFISLPDVVQAVCFQHLNWVLRVVITTPPGQQQGFEAGQIAHRSRSNVFR